MKIVRCAAVALAVMAGACGDADDGIVRVGGEPGSTPACGSASACGVSDGADASARDASSGKLDAHGGVPGDDTAAASPDAGSAPGPNGAPGACVPGAVCGGISSCVDGCYGAKCCLVSCTCGGPANDAASTLVCSVSC